MIVPLAVIVLVRYGRRQRDTPAGLAAAARWRAVQAKLAEDTVFAEQPPHAVALWERLLAYGAALGVAPGAIRPIPMGSEPENRAWSTYGGRWHQVDVRYRHGPSVGAASRLGAPCSGSSSPGLACSSSGSWRRCSSTGLDEVDGGAELILAALLAAPMGDRGRRARACGSRRSRPLSTNEVMGEIVRLRLRRSDHSIEYFVAVDDGRRKTVRAWAVRPDVYTGLEQGDVVTARVTPRLGYVRSIQRASA